MSINPWQQATSSQPSARHLASVAICLKEEAFSTVSDPSCEALPVEDSNE
eukprot:CAMPEP_0201638738 /NCGR_PEP_ID=MMETSP0493-20130528/17447_1 /ASSEMBLY_ACC=CAM_ASM_000838 /TAXON_ID=420259 /ORGANISM="Thalassiosira gravida, Strain GMp14c1" /LENGTH=49 /DNA_ID=CAMNT_0048111895 /DNA_START=22 /DNA_END=171 /DNA_ORIENTATION=+